MAAHTQQEEVDRNYEYFAAELPELLPAHAGKFALLRDRKIHGFYETLTDAYTAGNEIFSDGCFSIQQVTSAITDLGFYSHAVLMGAA